MKVTLTFCATFKGITEPLRASTHNEGLAMTQNSVRDFEIQQKFPDFLGFLGISGFLWISLTSDGFPWIFYEFPWISLDF